jgi:hypothetical protein
MAQGLLFSCEICVYGAVYRQREGTASSLRLGARIGGANFVRCKLYSVGVIDAIGRTDRQLENKVRCGNRSARPEPDEPQMRRWRAARWYS